MADQERNGILPWLKANVEELIYTVTCPYGPDDGFGDERDSPDPRVSARAWKRFRGGTPPEQESDPATLTEDSPQST